MANKSNDLKTPRFSRSAFWDIDLEKLDLDRFAEFAIIRIFERGTSADIEQILGYFGKSKIIDILTHAESLQPRAIALGEKLLGISRNQFSCSKPSRQVMSYSGF